MKITSKGIQERGVSTPLLKLRGLNTKKLKVKGGDEKKIALSEILRYRQTSKIRLLKISFAIIPVLKPNFDLSFCKTERMRYLYPSPSG